MRFSALGDVALILPVLNTVMHNYPGLEIVIATRGSFAPLFSKLHRTKLVTADFSQSHRGLCGLLSLYRQLKNEGPFDAVLDLHGVVRSHLLRFIFRISGTAVYRIKKERSARRALTRRRNKVLRPLSSAQERYRKVFDEAGYPVSAILPYVFMPGDKASTMSRKMLDGYRQPFRIGIAPFASYPLKEWGMDKMTALCRALSLRYNAMFVFFGFGDRELSLLRKLQDETGIKALICDGIDIELQLSLLRSLHCLICMDSSNLHLGQLASVPVVSVWGPTHPYAGFAPQGENAYRVAAVSSRHLNCRPCSVYGNKACFRHDHACMKMLQVETVIEMARKVLS